jgi:PDZ domain-containing secreted protein
MKIYYNEFKGNNPAAKTYKVATTKHELFINKLKKGDKVITKRDRAYNALENALAALANPDNGITSVTITITTEKEDK